MVTTRFRVWESLANPPASGPAGNPGDDSGGDFPSVRIIGLPVKEEPRRFDSCPRCFAAYREGQANWAMAAASKAAERGALGVRLPLLPLLSIAPWPSGRGTGLPKPDRRVRLPRGALGDRLTVGSPALTRTVEVRILLPEPEGNQMCPEVRISNVDPGQLLLVVTPRSERGGRWFDSSPRNSRDERVDRVGSQPAG